MASKIKVDQMQTVDGTGTIALQNQLSGMTTASLPTLTAAQIPTLTATQMPTGSVLQIKHATPLALTGVNTTSATLSDTGLTVSITPTNSSNKMVIVNLGGLTYRGSNYPNGKVTIHSSLTGGTLVEVARYHLGENDTVTGFYAAGPSSSIEESLSSWSSGAITYKVQFASGTGANYAYSNWGKASLYVMEIKG